MSEIDSLARIEGELLEGLKTGADTLSKGYAVSIVSNFSELTNGYVDEQEATIARIAGLLVGSRRHFSVELDVFERPDVDATAAYSQEYLAARIGAPQLERILSLIRGVHATSFRFPTLDSAGDLVSTTSEIESQQLRYLRAAEALAFCDVVHILAEHKHWIVPGGRGAITDRGPFVPRWDRSLGNALRLITHRVLIDCHSLLLNRDSRAWRAINKIALYPGSLQVSALMDKVAQRERARQRLSQRPPLTCRLVDYGDWLSAVGQLRLTPLVGDGGVLPYADARISLRAFRQPDLLPLSLYYVREYVDLAAHLYDILMVAYAISPFELAGILRIELDGSEARALGPPIVEALATDHGTVPTLVDGMHRVIAAAELGIERIDFAYLEGVTVPLVPLPVEWNEVQEYSSAHPPDDAQKRRYRFDRFEDFPHSAFPSASADSFRYFHFRDLSVLGSSGKRNFAKEQ